MTKIKLKEKKKLLARFIEIQVKQGYDIIPYLAKPFSYFNYDYLKAEIEKYDDEF